MNFAFDFMGRRKIFFVVSLLIILAGLVSLAVNGLNFGIDFTGGTRMLIRMPGAFTTAEIREVLAGVEATDATGRTVTLDNSFIQTVDDNNEVIIRSVPLTEDEREAVIAAISQRWTGFTNDNLLQVENVGPVVGGELLRNALLALLIASAGIIAYISYRFEFRYAMAALAALFFDAFVVIMAFSIFRVELNSPFVAAILTIVGYSINDTIVVFDRIRENVRYEGDRHLADTVNLSIRQTLVRSMNTSVTTLLVVGSLLFLGGDTIRPFALPLFIGIISGTYSSIFVASPIWYNWRSWGRTRKARA
jgi:preprotein translocase SecF subunit